MELSQLVFSFLSSQALNFKSEKKIKQMNKLN